MHNHKTAFYFITKITIIIFGFATGNVMKDSILDTKYTCSYFCDLPLIFYQDSILYVNRYNLNSVFSQLQPTLSDNLLIKTP